VTSHLGVSNTYTPSSAVEIVLSITLKRPPRIEVFTARLNMIGLCKVSYGRQLLLRNGGYVSTQGDMVKNKDNQAVRISTALPPTNAINSPMDRLRPGGGLKIEKGECNMQGLDLPCCYVEYLNASFAPTTVDLWRSVGAFT
jgi:hypothetical protein